MEVTKIKNRSQLALYALIVLGLIVIVNYCASFFSKRLDLTESHIYSISPSTKTLLKKLDDIVSVRVCISGNLPTQGKIAATSVKDMLTEYKAYGGRMVHITYEDPSVNEEKKEEIRRAGIPEIRMQSFEKDKVQMVNCFFGIIIQYGDRQQVIPIIQNVNNLEYELTRAIFKITRKSIPTIAVLKTDTLPVIPPEYRKKQGLEDFQSKYSPIFESLKKDYNVVMPELSFGEPIDTSIKTLIVVAPSGVQFSARDLFRIDQFFMHGGNLILLCEPVEIRMSNGAMAIPQSTEVEQLAEYYGARVEHSLVVDSSCGQIQVPQQAGQFQMNVALNYPYFVQLTPDGLNKNIPAISMLTDFVLPWTSTVQLLVPDRDSISGKKDLLSAPVTGTVLMRSSMKSWAIHGEVAGNYDLNPQQNWARPKNAAGFQPLMVMLSGNFKSFFAGKPVPPVKADDTSAVGRLWRTLDSQTKIIPENKNGHLIVVGNARFMSSDFNIPSNTIWLQNVVEWLSSDDKLISLRTRGMIDRTLNNDMLRDDETQNTIIKLINILLMPLIVIIAGILFYISRKEKKTPDSASAPEQKTEEKQS